jgi:hypothetical protein
MLVVTPTLASARVNDSAATRAYLRASADYARAEYAEAGASVAAIEARASEIARQCPSALAYAPRDVAFLGIEQEVRATVLYAGEAPVRADTVALARAIGHLSWSDRTLTRLVRAQASEEAATAALALPDVCADIAAWKASAYAALPASARRFVMRLQALESDSSVGSQEEGREALIMRMLRRDERPRDRRAVIMLERLQAQTAKRIEGAVSRVRATLASALGVSAV